MESDTRVDLAPLDRVDRAMERGEWHAALDLLRGLAAERELTTDELDRLGHAAYGAGELEAAVSAWERLHTRRIAAGDHVGAADAAARVATYLMMDTGLMAPVRGWIARAERLLESSEECAVHAVLAMTNAYERFMSGDHTRARLWADRAIEVGDRQGVLVAATLGRVARARLLIFDGHVEDGLRLLDEAAVTTMSGDLDPLATGMVYCELICAMQTLAQYDRAEQWTEAMEAWRHGHAFGGINGRCRVHRAEILRLRGSCDDAEVEALEACDALRPWMRREFGWPLTELGTIRLRKGDLDGAEAAFLEAHGHGWAPQPGLALLRLAQGRVDEARALIADALVNPVRVPSKERPPGVALCRAPLLEASVVIAAAAGDAPTARAAAEELSGLAGDFRSQALVAAAALARARAALAAGEAAAAVADAEAAVVGWSEVGAPYETADARTVLATAHRAVGSPERARLEHAAARTTFRRIGARLRADEITDEDVASGRHPSTDEEGTRPRTVATFRLDGDTRTVVFEGREVLLRDLKGMRYLERLLAAPGRELHVLDLVGAEAGATEATALQGGHAGPVLDAEAKEAYRRRLADIDDDLAEAHRTGDAERAALASADRDYLVRELARAFGLGGRERLANADSERARASVTRAIRYALARIDDHHPELVAHLEQTVSTGTYCAYRPDPRAPIRWVVAAE